MLKPAPSDLPIHDLIVHRWSPRAFTDQSVETQKLLTVLEAARWAASSYGKQPWSYIVATKDQPEDFAKLLSVLVEFNQAWAGKAPVLLLSLATTADAEGRENKHAFHDTGAASAQLSLQAAALGLQAHQMSGFYPEKAREVFALPENVAPVAAIAIGYPGDPDTLSDPLKERELGSRSRIPLSEFLYAGEFGKPWTAAGSAE